MMLLAHKGRKGAAMEITYEFALDFIEEHTPKSDPAEKRILARRLVAVCKLSGKQPEDAWAFSYYWMGC